MKPFTIASPVVRHREPAEASPAHRCAGGVARARRARCMRPALARAGLALALALAAPLIAYGEDATNYDEPGITYGREYLVDDAHFSGTEVWS